MNVLEQVVPDFGRVDVDAIYGRKHASSLRGGNFLTPNRDRKEPRGPSLPHHRAYGSRTRRLSVKPRNLRFQGRSTTLFRAFTASLSDSSIQRVTLRITRSPRLLHPRTRLSLRSGLRPGAPSLRCPRLTSPQGSATVARRSVGSLPRFTTPWRSPAVRHESFLA